MTTDYWHNKQKKFDNEEHRNRIYTISKELGFKFRDISLGIPNFELETPEEELFPPPEVTPIGRARELDEKYWGKFHMACKLDGCRLNPPTLIKLKGKYTHLDEITISPNGNVYPCNSGKEFKDATLSLGNIYEDSLKEILAEQKNNIVNLIKKKGLRILTKKAGLSLKEHWQLYDKMTPCGLCHEMLREYGKKVNKS